MVEFLQGLAPEAAFAAFAGLIVTWLAQWWKMWKKVELSKKATRIIVYVVALAVFYSARALMDTSWLPGNVTEWITPFVGSFTPFLFYKYTKSVLGQKEEKK